jgi:hypothetical protein
MLLQVSLAFPLKFQRKPDGTLPLGGQRLGALPSFPFPETALLPHGQIGPHPVTLAVGGRRRRGPGIGVQEMEPGR